MLVAHGKGFAVGFYATHHEDFLVANRLHDAGEFNLLAGGDGQRAPSPSKPNRPRLASNRPETVSTMRWEPQIIPGAGLWSTLDTVPLSVTSLLTSYRESESAALSGTTGIANRRPVSSPAISGIELMKRLCLMDSLLSRLPHHRPSARCTTLQREKCASNSVSAPL